MKTINGKRWYTPREVAQQKLITNLIDSDIEDSNYSFIHRLIKTGKLSARRYGAGAKLQYWLICEDDIERYNNGVTEEV